MKPPKTQIEFIEQLVKPELTLNKFFTLSLDLLYIAGKDGYFKQLSPAWEKILGWTHSELCMRPWIEWVHPDDVEITQNAQRRCRQKDVVEYENRFRHKTGDYRWLSWRISRDENGLSYGVAKDITAAKRLDEALCDRFNKAMRLANGNVSQVSHRLTQVSEPLCIKVRAKTPEDQAARSSVELSNITQSTALVEVEEKNLERALIELTEWQNRYEAVGQISGQLLYEWDSQADELIWGRNVEQVLGYSPKEIDGGMSQLSALIHPDDLEKTQVKFAYVMATKEPLYLEYRMRKKDGTYITVADKGRFYSDSTGNLNRMVGFIVDISAQKLAEAGRHQAMVELEQRVEERTAELKQANEQLQVEIAERQKTEAALRQSEAQFRRVFNEAPIGIVLESLDTRFLRVNQAFCEMLGYTDLELMSLTCQEITHPEDLNKQISYTEELREGAIESYQLEKRYFKKNQEILWVNLTTIVLRDKEGEILYILHMVEDITQRKQALEALRHSQARYRAIVEDQTELICRFKPDSTITFVNDAYCRYFNKPSESLLGHKFLPPMPPEDRKLITKNFGALCVENPTNTYEHRVILPGGKIRWQQWSDRALFDEHGHFIECQAVGRDITKLKQAEADIRMALAKEKELSELRSNFVSLVSHEFRTPLTTIQSSAELLDRYHNKLSDEKKQNHFKRIQTALTRMTQLLDDVLTIGQAEAGKLKFNPQPIDLVAFCHDTVESLQLTASPEHMLNFVVQGDRTDAQMDEKLLGHIVTNLLSNAIKYSPQGGTVQFDLVCNQSSAVFRIQDTGIGIPDEDLEKLFESFRRASNVGTIQGTGLGLAIVKKCVDLHGGQIAVTSTFGVGTTFTVTLPLNRQHLSSISKKN